MAEKAPETAADMETGTQTYLRMPGKKGLQLHPKGEKMSTLIQGSDGKTSTMRATTLMLVTASIGIGIYGFIENRDAFDIMMVAGMYLGGGLTGKLVQKQMERK